MVIKPIDWTVIIVGRWNRAILTPAGIGKRIFELDEETPVGVLVPLDGISPYLVKHPSSGIVVFTHENSLQFNVEKFEYILLEKAMKFGSNAIRSLPETPLDAVGINVKFETKDIEPDLAALLAGDIDKLLSSTGYNEISRTLIRSLEFKEGQLNNIIKSEKNSFEITFNFHYSSLKGDLETKRRNFLNWLETPVSEIQEAVDKILRTLNLELEDFIDVSQHQ